MTFEVQQTRWDRIIRRVSGSIGPGSRVSETLSELFPVLDVERVPGELLLLGGTRLAWGGQQLVASVGNTGKVQLFNPVDSGSLITVTSIVFTAQTNNFFRIAIEPLPRLTRTNTERYRDGRLGVGELPVGQVRHETTATIVTVTNRLWTQQNVTQELKDENGICVLSPGTGVTMASDGSNTQMSASFLWRERPAEESELSL